MLSAALRHKQESGAPVTIGSDVCVGSGAIVLPGVTNRVARRRGRWKRGSRFFRTTSLLSATHAKSCAKSSRDRGAECCVLLVSTATPDGPGINPL